MKRIEFIAPVEAMRGNLSGKQDLLYAENDNKAYEGPVGQTNYARNYSPRFIGAKVAKSGQKYFTVRTKSANHLTAKAKHAMALLGGTGAMYAAIVANKTSTLYQACYNQWLALTSTAGMTDSFRKSLSDVIRAGLASKQAHILYTGPNGAVSIDNPWRAQDTQNPNVLVPQHIIVKFWTELASQPAAVGYTPDGPFLSDANRDDLGAVSGYDDTNLCGLKTVEVKDGPMAQETFDAVTLERLATGNTCPIFTYNGEIVDGDTAVVNGMMLVLTSKSYMIVQ